MQVCGLLESRAAMAGSGERVDWATAEALAFGSIMMEPDPELKQTQMSNPAYPVRLSGQVRGGG